MYDDFGLLRYVLPPKAFESGSTTITSTELAQLCYQYEYDHRKRMIKKVLPGALPVYLVYDERDRLVATQEGPLTPSSSLLPVPLTPSLLPSFSLFPQAFFPDSLFPSSYMSFSLVFLNFYLFIYFFLGSHIFLLFIFFFQ